MEVILLGIYGFFVWLIFYKFKWLPMNFTAACIVITLPIVAMMALFLLLNIAAPATDDVRAMNYVIPIVPRITGQVTEVPIQPNRPIKKGDVLFKIDPVPFEAAVKAAEATLRGSEGSTQQRDGQKSGADSADRSGEKARRAIHGTRRDRGREAGRPRAGAKRPRQS